MIENKKDVICFLLGLHRVFVFVRSQIKKPINLKIMEIVNKHIEVLDDNGINEFKLFKFEILEVTEDDVEVKEFFKNALSINYENLDINNMDSIKKYLPILRNSSLEILKLLKDNNHDKAYDLVDVIHCLPELMSKSSWNENLFWKSYIVPYRKKWDKTFLNQYEKIIPQKSIVKRIFG